MLDFHDINTKVIYHDFCAAKKSPNVLFFCLGKCVLNFYFFTEWF